MKPTLYLNQIEVFDKKFDMETGAESISFHATETMQDMIARWLKQYEEPKEVLKYWSCCAIGRHADLERCSAVGVRVDKDNERVEIRLRFEAPWYWEQIRDRIQGHADSRTVGPVQHREPSLV